MNQTLKHEWIQIFIKKASNAALSNSLECKVSIDEQHVQYLLKFVAIPHIPTIDTAHATTSANISTNNNIT